MDPKLLFLQNPWWKNRDWHRSDVHISVIKGKTYYFSNPLVSSLEFKPKQIHILRGPRQVGKTTLLKEWIHRLISTEEAQPRNILMVSCEGITNFTELQQTLTDWLSQKRRNQVYLFLDEVTFVEEWQRAILTCSNAGLLQNTSVVITGSNARDLKESKERLPGRREGGKDLKLYPLLPFQYRELPCFKQYGSEKLIEIYLKIGGFPHAIRDFVTLGQISEETFRTYRNWIVGDATHYELSEEILKHILFRIHETTGSRVSWSKLIENTTVKSHETALNYIEHLQDAHLCELLYCYDVDKNGPSIHKARKIYFIDPLLYYLSYAWKNNVAPIWEWIQLPETFKMVRGSLLESAFAVQSKVKNEQKNVNTFFWYSTKTKQEVDLLFLSGRNISLFEVKWGGGGVFKALSQEVRILSQKELFSVI